MSVKDNGMKRNVGKFYDESVNLVKGELINDGIYKYYIAIQKIIKTGDQVRNEVRHIMDNMVAKSIRY